MVFDDPIADDSITYGDWAPDGSLGTLSVFDLAVGGQRDVRARRTGPMNEPKEHQEYCHTCFLSDMLGARRDYASPMVRPHTAGLLCSVLSQRASHAWSPRTHVLTANETILDAQDGALCLPQLGRYNNDSELWTQIPIGSTRSTNGSTSHPLRKWRSVGGSE